METVINKIKTSTNAMNLRRVDQWAEIQKKIQPEAQRRKIMKNRENDGTHGT